MLTQNLIYSTLFFMAGHTLGWFQVNSQFAWEWWRDRPLFTVCLYSVPTALCYLYGARYAYMDTGEAWAGRFIAFAASYFIFPILTWVFLKESPFTNKTLICFALSVIIMIVQFSSVTVTNGE